MFYIVLITAVPLAFLLTGLALRERLPDLRYVAWTSLAAAGLNLFGLIIWINVLPKDSSGCVTLSGDAAGVWAIGIAALVLPCATAFAAAASVRTARGAAGALGLAALASLFAFGVFFALLAVGLCGD